MTDMITELQDKVNNAYRERALSVACLGVLAHQLGYEVCRKESTEREWAILYIELPAGQVSWHFSTDDEELIEAFPVNNHKVWDGDFKGRKPEIMTNPLQENK